MFYVFGIHGPMYQGDARRLSHIGAVRGVARPAVLRPGQPGVADAPVQDDSALAQSSGRIRHAVSAYQEAGRAPQQERRQIHRVRDVMTHGAITLSPDTSVAQAWQVLADKKIAQAPVLNAQGLVVGMLLRADMMPLVLLPTPQAPHAARSFSARNVAQVMVTPVPAVSMDAELRHVTHVLLQTGLPGLPVTDEAGHLGGFVSRTDILRAVVSEPPLDLWS